MQKRILSLDPGSSHVGVAVYTEVLGIVALSEITWTNRFDLLGRINSHIEEYEITHVLVGDMGKEKLPEPFEMIRKKIEEEKQIPVIVVPERLSTHQAEYHDGSHSDAACEIVRGFINA